MPQVKVRSDGIYSGQYKDGKLPWPEYLYGAKEIAACLRRHPSTIGRWLRDGRLPGAPDPSGRWVTSRTLLNMWILARRRHYLSMPKGGRPRGSGPGATASRQELDVLLRKEYLGTED